MYCLAGASELPPNILKSGVCEPCSGVGGVFRPSLVSYLLTVLLYTPKKRRCGGVLASRKNSGSETSSADENPLVLSEALFLLYTYSGNEITRLLMSAIIWTLLSSLAAFVAATVVPLSNSSFDDVTDAPGVEFIDPRFSATYWYGQDRLSATSCLMNAANAMMELALENFTGPIDLRNYVDPNYPEVMVTSMAAGRRQTIEARYVLWGVWEGIRWMINHQSFRDLVIGAYWDDTLMCNIWIRAGRRQLSLAGRNGTLDLIARSERKSIHNTTVAAQGLTEMHVKNPLNDQHLTITVTRTGEMLGITESFIAVFAALEYMAHFPSAEKLHRFQLSPDNEGTKIGIQDHIVAPTVGPPLFDYQSAILSVAQIPAYMLQQRRFTEVIIEIAVDGVSVGEGFLSKIESDEDYQASGPK